MFVNWLDIVFGCRHANYSFPLTMKSRRHEGGRKGTYVVCLDCGREFAYDWNRMKVIAGEATPAPAELAVGS